MGAATVAVLMTVTMFLPNGGELKQAWQSVENTTLEHCQQMNEIFAQGGKAAVMTVRCEITRRALSAAKEDQ